MIELITLKNKIEQLNKKQQIEVLKIVTKCNKLFNLSSLNEHSSLRLCYINYVSDQENTLGRNGK